MDETLNFNWIEALAALLFLLALAHTFSTPALERLAVQHPNHGGLYRLLAEVEVVFGFWALVLVVGIAALEGQAAAVQYLESRNFTEPLFVFAVMVIAASRPILVMAQTMVKAMVQVLPFSKPVALYAVLLSVVPLLGSFITEPAAMTLAALMLRDSFLKNTQSESFKYITLGVLFVNVSIGGTLTPYAAPPVLMVASKWNWDLGFMLNNFGWKAALGVTINALLATALNWRALKSSPSLISQEQASVPFEVQAIHLMFLLGVVLFAHHPAVFLWVFMFFMGYTTAYKSFQSPLILKEALLVAFFLAGLVVLGGMQQWWLQPLLMSLSSTQVFYGATLLTAVTDNAALTYLGSLVEGLSEDFKIALVMGAVTGGGLTVIANAPNPAGLAILRGEFPNQAVQPLKLLLAALPATCVAILVFRLI